MVFYICLENYSLYVFKCFSLLLFIITWNWGFIRAKVWILVISCDDIKISCGFKCSFFIYNYEFLSLLISLFVFLVYYQIPLYFISLSKCKIISAVSSFFISWISRPWCWEGLEAGGEGDDRGWDGWMASLTRWTWVWVNSGSWWWTGRPGVLRFMGSQRVGHDWATELNWTESCFYFSFLLPSCDLWIYPFALFLDSWTLISWLFNISIIWYKYI